MIPVQQRYRLLAYGPGWCFLAMGLTEQFHKDQTSPNSLEPEYEHPPPFRQLNVYASRHIKSAAEVSPEPDSINPGDETPPGSEQSGEGLCPTCSGTGMLNSDAQCPDCGGAGRIMQIIGDA
jgi:hypothetical protein